MSNQIFADALGGILVTGGTVRLDFVAISTTVTEGRETKLELQERVIMPVEGFLRAVAKMQEAVQAMSRPLAPAPETSQSRPAAAAAPAENDKVPFP